jgi:hypothetical protein
MVLWMVLGVAVAMSHHVFCQYMNGKPVTSISIGISENQTFIGDQSFIGSQSFSVSSQQWTSPLGNALAIIVHGFFSAAIIRVFVQRFWRRIRARAFTVEQINAILSLQISPFNGTSMPAWYYAPQLSFIALLSFGMVSMSIVAPGALTVVQSNFTLPYHCTVSTVDLSQTDISFPGSAFGTALPPIRSLATQVLMVGTYLTPASPCGVCSYDVKFIAPALNCSNITASYNFKSAFPTLNNATIFWNATYAAFDTTGLNLQVAWKNWTLQNMQQAPQGAIQCVAYNATYGVRITHGTSTTIDITEMVYNNPLVSTGSAVAQLNAVVDAVATLLNGVVVYNNSNEQFTLNSNLLGYSLGHLSAGSEWIWDMVPTAAVPSLMANVSLSLLTGSVSVKGDSLAPVQETCYHSTLSFHYDRVRLLLTYGTGLAVTLVCILVGVWTVRKNGVEETDGFERMLDATLNDEMSNWLKKHRTFKPTTRLQAEKDGNEVVGVGPGQFRVMEEE